MVGPPMNTASWLTIAAILLGPIIAVLITRWVDNRRENNARRFDVFRMLMRNRTTPLSPEHVSAFNLVEIEFANDKGVMYAWRKLFEILVEVPAQRHAEDRAHYEQRLFADIERLRTGLLYSMAQSLGYKNKEQLEILESGFTPIAHQEIEDQFSLIRSFVISLSKGEKPLSVQLVDQSSIAPTETQTMPTELPFAH